MHEDSFVLLVAAEANADPRTVAKRLQGGPVRGRVANRIDAVIARLRDDATPPLAHPAPLETSELLYAEGGNGADDGR